MVKTAEDVFQRDGRMERKHVLLPPRLIRHVESMAEEAQVPFAEIVRRALWSYNAAADQKDNDATLEQLAQALIESNEKAIAYVDKVNRRLDKTHAELAKRRRDLAR